MDDQQTRNEAADGRSDSTAVLGVFTASYAYHAGYGAYDEKEYVVVATTEAEALGFALESSPDTKAEHWTIERINTNTPGATYITGRCS